MTFLIFYKKKSFGKKIFVKTAKKGIEIGTTFVYNVCIAAFAAAERRLIHYVHC